MIVKKAVSRDELDDVYRLRYQVYCLDRGYEVPEHYPDHREIDEYDPYSIHFIAYVNSHPVGTARLILYNPRGLPLEKHGKITVAAVCGTNSVAEISRYAVSTVAIRQTFANRSRVTHTLLSLVYQTGEDLGIEYVFAAMNSGLERLLSRCGITFKKAGSPFEYRGLRTPYFALVRDLGHVLGSHCDNWNIRHA